MNKSLKKILVTGASLLMMAGVGASLSNANVRAFVPYCNTFTGRTKRGTWTAFPKGRQYWLPKGTKTYGMHDGSREGHPQDVTAYTKHPGKDDAWIPKRAFKAIRRHHARHHVAKHYRRRAVKRHIRRHRKAMRRHYTRRNNKYAGLTYLKLIKASDSIPNDSVRDSGNAINFNGNEAKPFDIIDQPFYKSHFSVNKTIKRYWHALYHQLRKQGVTKDTPIELTFIYKPTLGRNKNKMYKVYTVKTNNPKLYNNHMKLIHSHKYNGYD